MICYVIDKYIGFAIELVLESLYCLLYCVLIHEVYLADCSYNVCSCRHYKVKTDVGFIGNLTLLLPVWLLIIMLL